MTRVAILIPGILVAVTLSGMARGDTVVQLTFNGQVTGDNGPINYFQVQLFDSQTPITVANFLKYVNHQDYDDTVIHREAKNFVMQGGGFKPQVNAQKQITALLPLTTYGTIQNEFDPARSNLRGTIAMAKVGGDPNSATSQWFVNLADNSENLDHQNGGFTVFGRVLGDGMELIDAVDSLPTYDLNLYFDPQNMLGSPFGDVPLFNNGSAFVMIRSAAVVPQWAGGAAAGPSDWGLAANWGAGSSVPGGAGSSIRFGSQSSANSQVDLGAEARTVGQITFTAGPNTTLESAAGKSLTLDNGAGTATIKGEGQQCINTAIRLNSSAAFAPVSAGDSLTINGDISDGANGGKGLAKYGAGRLVLSGANNYTGGTTVNLGILEIAEPAALPAGRSLTIGTHGAVVLVSGLATNGAAAQAVPEPSALALLGAVVLCLMGRSWRRHFARQG